MAKNTSREYATMDEEERQRFQMLSEGATDAAPTELNLDNPRHDEESGDEAEEAEEEGGAPPDRSA